MRRVKIVINGWHEIHTLRDDEMRIVRMSMEGTRLVERDVYQELITDVQALLSKMEVIVIRALALMAVREIPMRDGALIVIVAMKADVQILFLQVEVTAEGIVKILLLRMGLIAEEVVKGLPL